MPFLIFLLSGIGVLIYLRRMQYAQSRAEAKRYRRDYITLGILLLAIGVFYYFRQRGLATLIAPPLVESTGELARQPEESVLLVEGRIDPQTPATYRDYVAFTREDTTGATEYQTPPFALVLADGLIEVPSDNYNEWDWPREASPSEDYYYLRAGDRVLINGVYTRRDCSGEERPLAESPQLCASLIFYGDYEAYVRGVRTSINWNIAGMVAGLVTGLSGLSFVEVFLLLNRNQLTSGASEKD